MTLKERMRRAIRAAVITLGVCSASAAADTGKAILRPTVKTPKFAGIVTLKDVKAGLRLSIKLSGAVPGDHGIHIHEFGSCGLQGKEAGDHYNPRKTKHGNILTDGKNRAHAGDFGNIRVNEAGKAVYEVVVPDLKLAKGSRSVAGRAIVLHEKTDDMGQPSGNAGPRFACGTIMITGR